MHGLVLWRLRAVVLCTLVFSGASAADSARMLTASGAWTNGAPVFASSGDSLDIGGPVLFTQLLAASIPGDAAERLEQGFALQQGDVLCAQVKSVQNGQVAYVSALFGARTCPLTAVRVLALQPCALVALGLSATPAFSGALLKNGDRVVGQVTFINDASVGINNGKRVVQVPRARVLMVQQAVVAGTSSTTPGLQLRLANGDRLTGSPAAGAAGMVALSTAALGTLTVPTGLVRAAWREDATLLPVSTLTPVATAFTPRFDETTALGVDRALDGGWLELAGQRYERGLALRAGMRVDYDLPAGSETFLAEVGAASGTITLRVLADGKQLYDSGERAAGAPPATISVALAGARRLTLQTLSAGNGVGVFGWAFIAK